MLKRDSTPVMGLLVGSLRLHASGTGPDPRAPWMHSSGTPFVTVSGEWCTPLGMQLAFNKRWLAPGGEGGRRARGSPLASSLSLATAHWPVLGRLQSGSEICQNLTGLDGPDAQARRYCLEVLEGWNG